MSVTTNREAPFSLVLRREIAAPRAAVWRCWTEAHLLQQWYCPKPWTVPEAEIDLRPGGRMNCVMQGPDGTRIEVKGIWLAIEPETRLIFTDAYAEGFLPQPDSFMTGFVELADAPDGGTALTWGARHRNEADVQKHLEMGFEEGWKAASNQLDELARRIAARDTAA